MNRSLKGCIAIVAAGALALGAVACGDDDSSASSSTGGMSVRMTFMSRSGAAAAPEMPERLACSVVTMRPGGGLGLAQALISGRARRAQANFLMRQS